MKRKRVEYQKYIRTKLEQERYRELFGLTDNILEFKSYNDPLTTVLLTKYIGQLFWWLYAKRQEAKKNKNVDIRGDEVTLNIVTVGRPRNVINELDELLGENFIRHGGGYYQCNVMGVELHIFVINEFPIEREYYAWLIFSEGKQHEKFREKLVQEIEKNEEYQIYLELIDELEKEGSEKMAYEILSRILSEMPVEQKQKVVSSVLSSMPADIMKSILSEMPVEQKQETIKDILRQMSKEERQKIIEQL